MSDTKPTISSKYKALPRSARWLIILCAFLGVYFLVLEPVIGQIGTWNAKADEIASRIDSAAAADRTLSQSTGELDRVMTSLGKIRPPSTEGEAQAALDRRLSEIVRARNATEIRRSAKPPADFNAKQAAALAIDPSMKLQKLSIELRIDCDTTTLMNILKDLETAAEVHAIAKVEIRKGSDSSRSDTDGLLNVTITVETWRIGKPTPNTASIAPTANLQRNQLALATFASSGRAAATACSLTTTARCPATIPEANS